jgi:subtilisin family serine protease
MAGRAGFAPWVEVGIEFPEMDPLELVKLRRLTERTIGRPQNRIGLIDGPVAMDHPGLETKMVRQVPGGPGGRCTRTESAACAHGTFVAGILCGKRDSAAPSICPGCTLLVRAIFPEASSPNGQMPSATPGELAAAIVDCVAAGAQVINLSLALEQRSADGERELGEALDHAMRSGVIIVAAAGNQGTVGGTAITRHPWVIPVVACDLQGWPTGTSNLGRSIGRLGLCAPGEGITSLGTEGEQVRYRGTSVATPFVTGAIALLWSEFPAATAAQVKRALTRSPEPRRTSVVPPLLNAEAAYQILDSTRART